MNKISPAQYRAHYYKEVDQIFILPRLSCASSPTISIDSGDCGIIICLLIKQKIQTRSNDRFGLKLGNVLAHLGQRACPPGATCLPIMGTVLAPVGQIGFPIPAHLRSSANACNSIHLTIPLISKPSRQLPDNRMTVNYLYVRILQQKTRQSDSFDDFP